jgi:hypothetical protein
MEAFSSNRDGTLTVVKENSPTSFVVEQNVATMTGAKTLTLDTKTNHIVLIAAEYLPPPAPTVQDSNMQGPPPGSPVTGGAPQGGRGPGGRGGRGPRPQMVQDSFTILVVGK